MASVAGSIRKRTATTGIAKRRRIKLLELPSNVQNTIIAVLLVAVLAIMMVACSAYSAKLQTENNKLQANISNLQADIDSLNEQIVEHTKLETITNVAMNKLGMVYPSSDNCIRINSGEVEEEGSLAAAIKNEAFN